MKIFTAGPVHWLSPLKERIDVDIIERRPMRARTLEKAAERCLHKQPDIK
jgi:hypothetical protein